MAGTQTARGGSAGAAELTVSVVGDGSRVRAEECRRDSAYFSLRCGGDRGAGSMVARTIAVR